MDQLTAHKTKRVKAQMEKLGMQYILAPIYSPEANPIEFSFAKVKRIYKKRKLEALSQGTEFDPDQEITDAFNSIKSKNAQAYADKSNRFLIQTS